MKFLLRLSSGIDAVNEWIARRVIWLVLIVTLISAGNAVVRKVFNSSSNGLLEIQWYLFSAIFLLCAGYTLLRNAHVRIDLITSRLGVRATAWVDILGTLFFLLPAGLMIAWLSWDVFLNALRSGEVSPNQGGLILWPARLLVPVGFALLLLQGVSELIKRVAFLLGLIETPTREAPHQSEEMALADEIRRQQARQTQDASSTGAAQ